MAYVNAVGHKSSSACLVSAADKLHDAHARVLRDFRTRREELWSRFNPEAGCDGAFRDVLPRTCGSTFTSRAAQLNWMRRVQALTDELTTVVSELEAAVGADTVWPPVSRGADEHHPDEDPR